jgi:hypothetical protein
MGDGRGIPPPRSRFLARDKPRSELDGLPKEGTSEWIEELKGYATRAGLGGGVPLRSEHLARLGAWDDALAQPPARSVAPKGNNGGNGTSNCKGAEPNLPLGDEAWLRVEFSAGVSPHGGDGTVVTVSTSAHLAHGPREEDAEAFGELVHRFREREVARPRLGKLSGSSGNSRSMPAGPPCWLTGAKLSLNRLSTCQDRSERGTASLLVISRVVSLLDYRACCCRSL